MTKPASQNKPASAEVAEPSLLDQIMEATADAPTAPPAVDPLAEARKLLAEAEERAKRAEERMRQAEERERAAVVARKRAARPVVHKTAKPANKGADKVIGSATYKGRRYNVLWCGRTRTGKRMYKLCWKSDPSKVFWVDAYKVRDPKIKPSTGLTCPGNNNCRNFGWPRGRNCS